jgi:Tfp pilus assembly protein FimV
VSLGPAEVAASHELIVQPGDTLWSIAASIAPPHTDVRATVDRLDALNGHQVLTVGEHLRLP